MYTLHYILVLTRYLVTTFGFKILIISGNERIAVYLWYFTKFVSIKLATSRPGDRLVNLLVTIVFVWKHVFCTAVKLISWCSNSRSTVVSLFKVILFNRFKNKILKSVLNV